MKLTQFLKNFFVQNFVNKEHHGAPFKTPRGFVCRYIQSFYLEKFRISHSGSLDKKVGTRIRQGFGELKSVST